MYACFVNPEIEHLRFSLLESSQCFRYRKREFGLQITLLIIMLSMFNGGRSREEKNNTLISVRF